MKIHLGCGNDKFDDYINIDRQITNITDKVMDLDSPVFPDESVNIVFSNKFFDQLKGSARVEHLSCVRKALRSDGFCCYIGMPHSEMVAQASDDKVLDKNELSSILDKSGFNSYKFFTYSCYSDINPNPVYIGFYALKKNDTFVEEICKDYVFELYVDVMVDTFNFI